MSKYWYIKILVYRNTGISKYW